MPLDVWLFLFLVPLPLVLIHELGHAAAGLLRTRGLVRVVVGTPPAHFRARIGRLALEISLRRSRGPAAGYAQTYALGVPPLDRFLISISGPLASAFVATILWLLVADVHGVLRHLVVTAAGVATFQAVVNMLPLDYTHSTTVALDGKRALEALKGVGATKVIARPALDGSSTDPFVREFNETWTRWGALFSRASNPAHLPLRARALAVSALVSEVEPGSPAGQALTNVAKAGWCWREVERGTPQALEARVRVALKKAAQTGAVRPELQVRAACELLARPVELSEASPGSTDQARKGFIARASRSAVPAFERLGLDREQTRMAFLYGIALHDVERYEPIELTPR